ncbi:hypothetical protein BRC82_09270 [Halobacteriales archaeon QS_1_67_19]|nr:MAG: hypothetical protein BRC82_09270 [Halobacteriales archaeon QS_1_67_19]
MVEDRTTARKQSRSRPDDEPSTLWNALVGAVVTVVTAPLLPLAAIVGGGVAGYLQRGDLAAGAKVGAIAGAMAAVPAVLFAWLVVGFFLLGGASAFALGSVFAVFVLVAVVGYLVGASALGGAVGAYVRREF